MQVFLRRRFIFNTTIRRTFCQQKNSLQEKESKQDQNIKEQNKYIYAKDKFDIMNSSKFMDKIQKMEQLGQRRSKALESLKFPVFLIGSSLFIYHLWQRMPYGIIFRHTTISEYIPREYYLHASLVAPISFQTTGHLLVYWPLMVLSLYLNGTYMKTKHMMLLYLTTAIVSCGVTLAYERHKNQKLGINMISPKCIGAVTPLAFASAYLAINPGHLLFNQRLLPFFVIPVLYYMYELEEFQKGYVNELCRPAHIAASGWGILFGLIFKRFVLKGMV